MTAFPARAVLAVLAGIAGGDVALAQYGEPSGPPIPLIGPSPGRPPASTPTPGTLPPGALPSSTLPSGGAVPTAGGRVDGGFFGAPVESNPLSPLDSAAVGLVDRRGGGLPADMWRGTSRSVAERLVAELPAAPGSRALRDLQYRLLVTAAEPPEGPGTGEPGLFARRLGRLIAMGERETVSEMLRRAGPQSDSASRRAAAESQLFVGDLVTPCATAQEAVRESDDVFWAKLLIVCQLAAGETAQAALSNDLLRERGGDNAAFVALVDYALHPGGGRLPSRIPGDALSLAVLSATGRPVPAALARQASPPVLRHMAENEANPIALRLEAAERGEAIGAVDANRLLTIYRAVAEGAGGLPAGAARRAQLVAEVDRSVLATDKTRALEAVYQQGRADGLYGTMARVTGTEMAELQPSPELTSFAPEAVRAWLVLNEEQKAVAWYNLLSGGASDPRYAAERDRLWPLVQLADSRDAAPWEGGHLRRWYDLDRQHDPTRAAQRALLIADLLRAVGEPVDPAELNISPIDAGRRAAPRSVALEGLAMAAGQGRVAEAVALALLAVGEQPVASIRGELAAEIASRLTQIGLGDVARRFAVEVALAHGF